MRIRPAGVSLGTDRTAGALDAALALVRSGLPGGGEPREGQRRMAFAVASAIARGRHLVVAAGTGTGKSLGYLVPAVVSGRRVVVATATTALQDQLAAHELPLLSRRLRPGLSYAVLKGRANYLCLQRAAESAQAGDRLGLGGLDEPPTAGVRSDIDRLLRWATATATGDRAELAFEPRPEAWAALSVGSETCPGVRRCPVGEACFAERARAKAARAQVLVVTTHLYCSHVASGGTVLPPHDVVVFDEAHELEDVASSAFATVVGAGSLRTLGRMAAAVLRGEGRALGKDLEAAAGALEEALSADAGRRLRDAELPHAELGVATRRVRAVVRALGRGGALRDPTREAARARVLHLAERLVLDLAHAAAPGPNDVVWVDGTGRTPLLTVTPIDVGAILAERCFSKTTAILTSATVPPGLAEQIALGPHDELDVGSPFPYERQALLYCAAHLPDPRSPEAQGAAHEELVALVAAAGGRTLGLFTSVAAMRRAAEAVRARLPYPVLVQGDLPKPLLVRSFAAEEAACLFATMGFWQGLDVPGPTLSLVVIDRLPFPRPDEPVIEARREAAGAAAFRTIDLPRAATLLAQGAGRLVRSADDAGVVAVLDPRLARASYRAALLAALPPMARTTSRAEVEAFLRGIRERSRPG